VRNSPFHHNRFAYGWKHVVKFGGNPAVNATENVWQAGGNYTWPTSAQPVVVTSDSAEDDAGGDGALTLKISGLDANCYEIDETLTLSGADNATTTKSFFRVFRAFCDTVGTYGTANNGTLTAVHQTSIDTLFEIPAGVGQTKLALYTVPAGFTAFIMNIHLSVSSSRDGCTFELYRRENADDTTTPNSWRLVSTFTDVLGNVEYTYGVGNAFAEQTDIEFRATRVSASSEPSVEVEFEMFLVPNDAGL
jgi:hypothetical protein